MIGRPLLVVVVWMALFGLVACATPWESAIGEPIDLPSRSWLPADEPRAVILAVHGFNDYSHAFTDFGEFAAGEGVAVYAYDQRGFGANPGAGRWPGRATLIADLERECGRLRALHPGQPVYLLGESMGAAVIIVAASAEGSGEVWQCADGLILSAPAVWGGDQLNPVYRATLWVAARLFPGVTVTGDGVKVTPSDNIEMLRGLGADPLFIKDTRLDALAGLVGLMDQALAEAERVPGPTLVLGGARDEIVPPDAHQAMLTRLTASPCVEVLYPDGYHMLLRDLQREVVWQDILAWIDGKPPPSGLANGCSEPVTSAAASPGQS